jgi:hypothetical protein
MYLNCFNTLLTLVVYFCINDDVITRQVPHLVDSEVCRQTAVCTKARTRSPFAQVQWYRSLKTSVAEYIQSPQH